MCHLDTYLPFTAAGTPPQTGFCVDYAAFLRAKTGFSLSY
jgi:hypothetical protein